MARGDEVPDPPKNVGVSDAAAEEVEQQQLESVVDSTINQGPSRAPTLSTAGSSLRVNGRVTNSDPVTGSHRSVDISNADIDKNEQRPNLGVAIAVCELGKDRLAGRANRVSIDPANPVDARSRSFYNKCPQLILLIPLTPFRQTLQH